MTTPFQQAIRDIYRVHPGHIFPFIGGRYLDPDPQVVRVLVLGINVYVDDAEWPAEGPDPSSYATWYRDATWRYQKRVQKAVRTLVAGLTEGPTILQGRRFLGTESTCATNAVKIFLPASKGKKASQVAPEHFERHRDQWHRELRLMAELDVLPHLLVVFGLPSWPTAWEAFCPSPSGTKSGLLVTSYRNTAGPARHHLNRIIVELESGRLHDLLLVRLRHPSGRSKTGSPTWLLRQPDFRAMVGLASAPPSSESPQATPAPASAPLAVKGAKDSGEVG
jgi:hypothetical protein